MKNDHDLRCSRPRPCLSAVRCFGLFPAERSRVVRAHVVTGHVAASGGVNAVPNDAIVTQWLTQSVSPSEGQSRPFSTKAESVRIGRLPVVVVGYQFLRILPVHRRWTSGSVMLTSVACIKFNGRRALPPFLACLAWTTHFANESLASPASQLSAAALAVTR